MTATLESLVLRFYHQMWNRCDDEIVDEVLAPDFTFRGSLGTETIGPDGWRTYRDTIRTGSSDFHNKLDSLLIDRDRAAARLTFSGTHDGELAGLPATGRRFAYAGAAFFACSNGRLSSAWVLGDLTGLHSQILA